MVACRTCGFSGGADGTVSDGKFPLKPGVYKAEISRQYVARPHGDIPPNLKQLVLFLNEFNSESQRGAALLAASMLDEQLKSMLEAFLIEGEQSTRLVSGYNAPLGTFASRLGACMAMGLVTASEFEEIDLIRQIRNQFGHNLGVSFNSPKVRALCDKLTMSVGNIAKVGTPPTDAHGRFITAAVSLVVEFTNRAHEVGKKRLVVGEWKSSSQ